MAKLPDDPEMVESVDRDLDAFEQSLAGLPPWSEKTAPEYLNMSVDELRHKSPEELVEAVFALNQYGLNVQRLINKLRAWERYCIANLDTLEARYIPDVSTQYGFNERPKLARQNPEPCKKMNEYLRKIRMQLDRLYGIPEHVKLMADTIRDMRFIAQKREREYANQH